MLQDCSRGTFSRNDGQMVMSWGVTRMQWSKMKSLSRLVRGIASSTAVCRVDSVGSVKGKVEGRQLWVYPCSINGPELYWYLLFGLWMYASINSIYSSTVQ